MKIGRNELCPCGSGKKYKVCCLGKDELVSNQKSVELEEQIHKNFYRVLEHDKTILEESILENEAILKNSGLSKEQTLNVKIGLIEAKQHLGRHKEAIEIIQELRQNWTANEDVQINLLHKLSVSLLSLGATGKACEIFDRLIDLWDKKKNPNEIDIRMNRMMLIDAGKAYKTNGEIEKAKKCWTDSSEYLKERPEDIENYTRVKSNLALIYLNDEDDKNKLVGVGLLEDASLIKLKIGDIQGLANNYCNLGTYFRGIKRYERAIAYYRKDLFLSEKVGNKREIAATLGNLATLYGELKQFKEARLLLKRADDLATELRDHHLKKITAHQLEKINGWAKECGLNNIVIGKKAICSCGSGKFYSDCCGQADFEPIDIPHLYGGISEDHESITNGLEKLGKTPSPLDFMLRDSNEASRRMSWCEIRGHDGWVSLKELPDMANIHLLSAKSLLGSDMNSGLEISKPLSAIILSVCSLEAFINQLSFFLYENKNHPELSYITIPKELEDLGALQFQRTTSLEFKWSLFYDCFIGRGSVELVNEWKEAKDLIYIRNELVHFKASGYEQVVPPPKIKPIIYSKVPGDLEIKDVQHSWPMRLLNTQVAKWAVKTAETMITDFKKQYKLSREK